MTAATISMPGLSACLLFAVGRAAVGPAGRGSVATLKTCRPRSPCVDRSPPSSRPSGGPQGIDRPRGGRHGTVYDRVAHDLATVKASVTRLQALDPAPLTWWSAGQLRDLVPAALAQGRQAAADGASRRCRCRGEIPRLRAALSRWVGEHVSGTGGFRVTQVIWALTAARRDALFADARTRAVRDALARAPRYADALELGTVPPSGHRRRRNACHSTPSGKPPTVAPSCGRRQARSAARMSSSCPRTSRYCPPYRRPPVPRRASLNQNALRRNGVESTIEASTVPLWSSSG